MDTGKLIACHECDMLNRVPEQHGRGVATCPRCRAVLHRSVPNSLDRTLALTSAGLILFVVANSLPFLAFSLQGQ